MPNPLTSGNWPPLPDIAAQAVRESVLYDLAADPERYLSDYSNRFGNVLNADNAATLFESYNRDRARFRVAVNPAATWLRDELFRRALANQPAFGKRSIVFTAEEMPRANLRPLSLPERAATHSQCSIRPSATPFMPLT